MGNTLFSRDTFHAEKASLIKTGTAGICVASRSNQQRVQIDREHQTLLESGIEEGPIRPLILVPRADAVLPVLPGNLICQLKLVRGPEVREQAAEKSKALGQVDKYWGFLKSTGSRSNPQRAICSPWWHQRRRIVGVALERRSCLVHDVVRHQRSELQDGVLVSENDVFVDAGKISSGLAQ